MKTRNAGLLGLLFGALLTAHTAFAHQAYSKVVVFGDSLSDPGNAFALIGQFSVAPYNLIPDAPYAIGGMHFSNGKTWSELLAKDLHLPSGPAFRNPLRFSNYAIGGARARSAGSGTDLTAQVNLYLGEHNQVADPNALYVILIGGDDIRDAIVAVQTTGNPAAAGPILTAAVTAIADNLQALAAAGAHHFLIGNAPNLALVPAVSQLGPVAQLVAQGASQSFNTGLDQAVDAATTAFSLDVTKLDVFSLLQSLVSNPGQIGLDDVTDPCITPGVIAQAKCVTPAHYLFWDGIHPTEAVHAFFAQQAFNLLQ
jgi:phospholipase/lecithinase/hemolysin